MKTVILREKIKKGPVGLLYFVVPFLKKINKFYSSIKLIKKIETLCYWKKYIMFRIHEFFFLHEGRFQKYILF